MDPKFADRMNDLSEISAETLEQRWSTLTTVANAATPHQQARLVLIACGEPMNRTTDTWFWEPFRENEITIPVDDGAALFTRFAECASRYLIEVEDYDLPAMLVRLALNAGKKPFHQDLVDAAAERLDEVEVTVPSFSTPANYWTKAMQAELTENPADTTIASGHLNTVATNGQNGLNAVAKQVAALTNWAADAEQRFSRENDLIQWLLNGAREDGKAWGSLDPAVTAIDAAAELAQYVIGAPQPRHEAMLAQVLAVAGIDTAAVKTTVKGLSAEFDKIDDSALAALTPITAALADGKAIPKKTPSVIAERVLWEVTTVDVWNA